MQERPDTELIELAAGGDKGAFGLLAERYQVAAQRFALRLTSDKDWARELTQEAPAPVLSIAWPPARTGQVQKLALRNHYEHL